MASPQYIQQLTESKVYILPDVFPWSGIHIQDSSVIDGLVTNCSIYTGANIGSADVKFPRKVFGDHVKGLTPVKICVGDLNNVFMRGFINEEDGVLSESEDTVKCKVVDYKWYFSKCTRIRGRWYTVNGETPVTYGSPNTLGTGKLKYEMFRGDISSPSGYCGYLQNMPTIFNETGLPTCQTTGRSGSQCIFKMRKLVVTDGVQKIEKYNYGAHYWTFSSVLSHILHWWLKPYGGIFSPIDITSNSFAELSRLDDQDSVPMDLSIENMNPLEAIDAVVKAIPGKWIWWLTYQGTQTLINIKNVEDNLGPWKKLYVGDGSKQALNPANVADINVVRNWENSSSFLVIKGGKLRLTTTVELMPTWDRKTVSGVANLPFLDVADFEKWKMYITNKKKVDDKTQLTVSEKNRYEQAFRHYCIPISGDYLKTALDNVTFKSSAKLTGRLKNMYAVIETDLRKMFAKKVAVPREFGKPCHPEFDHPVFFAYDQYMQYSPKTKDANTKYITNTLNSIIIYDKGFNFDSDTGLVVFEQPQYCRFDYDPKKSITEEEAEAQHNAEDPNAADKTRTHEKLEGMPDSITDCDGRAGQSGITGSRKLMSRRIFCTLSIVIDMPYMVGEDVFGLANDEGGNFSRYTDLENIDLVMHCNAFYPVLPHKKVTVTSASYVLATQGSSDFPIWINSLACTNLLYPAEKMTNYELFPKSSDTLLLKKLDNFISAINRYDENITANLGTLDMTYKLGDMIVSVENTKTENEGSGYYGLNDYVSQITVGLEGQTEGYATTITATNEINFTPRDFAKSLKEEVRRPSVFRGKYESNGFLGDANA